MTTRKSPLSKLHSRRAASALVVFFLASACAIERDGELPPVGLPEPPHDFPRIKLAWSAQGKTTIWGEVRDGREDGRIGEAVHLGGSLDSQGDDLDATFAGSDRLVFSRGDARRGAAALFSTKRSHPGWDLPQRLPDTINCSQFVLGPSVIGRHLAFSARCGDDTKIRIRFVGLDELP